MHVKERIGGTLNHAGDIGGDVGDGFQIFAVEVALAGGALDVNEFGKRNQRGGGIKVGAHIES